MFNPSGLMAMGGMAWEGSQETDRNRNPRFRIEHNQDRKGNQIAGKGFLLYVVD